MNAFGQHLMIDGYVKDRAILENIDFIYNFLDHTPDEIKMTKIMPPYVFKYSGLRPEDWGISGVVLIAESHISIHTFPEKSFFSIDIFSCKEFNTLCTINYIKSLFNIEKMEVNELNRGLEFPRSISLATNIVTRERQRYISE